jgi:hypothetical protein
MANEISLTFTLHSPPEHDLHVLRVRWVQMKQELGEPITPADIRDELIPLLLRLYTYEIT